MTEHSKQDRIWYQQNQDGTRKYTYYCCCDQCYAECDMEQLPYSIPVNQPPTNAIYLYNGGELSAEETALVVHRDWSEALAWSLQTAQEMVYTLRPGDYFCPDEPWADTTRVTRIR